MTVSNIMKNIWKDAVVANLKYYFVVIWERLRKVKTNQAMYL